MYGHEMYPMVSCVESQTHWSTLISFRLLSDLQRVLVVPQVGWGEVRVGESEL